MPAPLHGTKKEDLPRPGIPASSTLRQPILAKTFRLLISIGRPPGRFCAIAHPSVGRRED
jgi:hypothetical protein